MHGYPAPGWVAGPPGAALTRFGVYEAGMVSARDPKYTVVPQRERIAARAAEQEHSSTITR